MTNKTREQAIEKIAKHLCIEDNGDDWENLGRYTTSIKASYMRIAEQFLDNIESLGYVLKDPDQSLPKPSIYVPSESDCETNEVNLIARHYYLTGQQDMVKKRWRKIIAPDNLV